MTLEGLRRYHGIELLFLPSFLPILQLLQITPEVFISTKYSSKNASLIIPKTTPTVDDIFNILSANTHSFRGDAANLLI